MSNFILNQQPSTIGSVIIMSGMLVGQALFSDIDKVYVNDTFKNEADTSGTFSEYSQITNNHLQYKPTKDVFEKSIMGFYTRLLASQEPLGTEFEEVLFDNLWDLYED